jgi:hypothetical protein
VTLRSARPHHPYQRWQVTIAVAAALSLFVALIAGSALRPKFAAAAFPEPAAWTHTSPHPHPHPIQSVHTVVHNAVHLDQALARGLSQAFSRAPEQGALPTNKKPFHSMWMTRDWPTSWTEQYAQPDWAPLPASFTGSGFQPSGTHWGEAPAPPAVRDTSTELCIVRC